MKFGKTEQITWFESKRMLNIVIELEVWMKKAKRLQRLNDQVLRDQKRYKKLRNTAHNELRILEEYFGRTCTDNRLVCQQILFHLNASQKEISYFGLRGIFVGIIAAIFTYGFNSLVLPMLLETLKKNVIGGFLFIIIITIIFILLFFMATWEYFSIDRKRRTQLYINEYMIELIKEKFDNLDRRTS
jgi:hypothetical protein